MPHTSQCCIFQDLLQSCKTNIAQHLTPLFCTQILRHTSFGFTIASKKDPRACDCPWIESVSTGTNATAALKSGDYIRCVNSSPVSGMKASQVFKLAQKGCSSCTNGNESSG
jgi:hypothetical protein